MSVIRVDRLGRVAVVMLNRPDVHNAITPEMPAGWARAA
jgi:enoyl-CoA hydratase/carnithine racemase